MILRSGHLAERVNVWFAVLTSPGLWRWSWLVIFLVALFARPPYPVDETRYLAVAWEMWRDGHVLVPQLNGVAYPDKPPLLFWLWQLGWHVFGVGDAWPRFLAAAFMGGSAFGLHRIAARLWPDDERSPHFAPLVFIGTLYVALYTQMLMFDSLVTLLVVASALALVSPNGAGWKTGLLLGLGMLGKGPIVLVYVLPLILFLPQFATRRWRLLFVTFGTSLLLPGAWFAALWLGGHADFIDTLLFGQIAARVDGTIGHGRPLWWYLPMLPLVLLPWSVLPVLWKNLLQSIRADRSVRGLLLAAAVTFAVLSVIGGKQVHYLLPLVAILAVPLGRAFALGSDPLPFSLFQLLVAVAVPFLLLPVVLTDLEIVHLNGIETLDWWPVLLPVTLLLAGLFLSPPARARTLALLSLGTVVMALAILLLVFPAMNRTHDLREVAMLVSSAQRTGFEVAYIGNYQGELDFLGRLESPISEIDESEVLDWQRAHPDAVVVAREKRADHVAGETLFVQPYRGGELVVRVTGAALPAARR